MRLGVEPGEQAAQHDRAVRLDADRRDFAVGPVLTVGQRDGSVRLERGVHAPVPVQAKDAPVGQSAPVRLMRGLETAGHQNLSVLEHLDPVDPAGRGVDLRQGVGEGTVKRPVQLQPGHARHGHPVKHQEPTADDHAVVHLHRDRGDDAVRAESRVERLVERAVRIQPGDVGPGDPVERPKLTDHDDASKRIDGDVVNVPVRAGTEVERLVHRPVEVDADEVVVVVGVERGEFAGDEQEVALVHLDDVHGVIRPLAGVEHAIQRAVRLQSGYPDNRGVVEIGKITGHDHRAVRHQLDVADGSAGPETSPERHIHRAGRCVGCLIVHDIHHRAGNVAQRRAAHHVVERDEEILIVLQRTIVDEADDELFAEVLRPELKRAGGRLEVGKLPGRDR